jgi:hypothetical protein
MPYDILVPNDYLTIQAGVDAAEEGDTIQVSPGSYDERVSLNGVAPGVSLVAEPGAVVLGFDTTGAGAGLTISGFSVTDGGAERYAVLIGSDNVTIEDCYIYDVDYAVTVDDTTPWVGGGVIQNNHIYKCGMGILVRGDGWLIEYNEVERLFYRGHDADYTRVFGDGAIIRGNYFHGTYQSEIGSAHPDGLQSFDNNGPASTRFLFERNVVIGFGQGIMLEGVNEGTVQDNVFVGDYLDAPGAGGWGINAKYDVSLVVLRNHFINIAHHGVKFRYGGIGVVQENVFYDAGSNYSADAESQLVGGFNTLNNESWPNYLEETDVVDPDLVVVFHAPSGVPYDIGEVISYEEEM